MEETSGGPSGSALPLRNAVLASVGGAGVDTRPPSRLCGYVELEDAVGESPRSAAGPSTVALLL